MRRSEINTLVEEAREAFRLAGWTLPPNPCWDVTDFGLGDVNAHGLILVNLAEEPEYCEKLMYARPGMRTPAHCHHQKKEDIIARAGSFRIQLWASCPPCTGEVKVKVNREWRTLPSGDTLDLRAGERITLFPGVFHEFWPLEPNTVIGEVSTANDDTRDNDFANTEVGRYPGIEEDQPPLVKLVSDQA